MKTIAYILSCLIFVSPQNVNGSKENALAGQNFFGSRKVWNLIQGELRSIHKKNHPRNRISDKRRKSKREKVQAKPRERLVLDETGQERKLYDFSVSSECDCRSCTCGKGCTETCCSTCYTYYTYCTPGRYNQPNYVEESSVCTACPAGQYQPNSASTSCIRCPAGYYCPSAATSMTECPRGYYCPTKKTPAPVACPAGYYCPDVRTITFTNNTCPAGYYCPTASINATICPAGYYCPSLAANRTACSPGTYSPVDASTSCTNCSVDKTSKVAAKECVYYPSPMPTATPSIVPSPSPSQEPTPIPSAPSSQPSQVPTSPTSLPSAAPTALPTPTPEPTVSMAPRAKPTPRPTASPSAVPVNHPTPLPSASPSQLPSATPTPPPVPVPTLQPTMTPTDGSTPEPTAPSPLPSSVPTATPTACEDASPYCKRVKSFCATSFCPTCPQAHYCDVSCNFADCSQPTPLPSPLPTPSPTPVPTSPPTLVPTPSPTSLPTLDPSHAPTATPTPEPTPGPTLKPSPHPTSPPSHVPTSSPTHLPTPNCEGEDPGLYMLTLRDSAGNGWNGVQFEIENSNETLVYSTTLGYGSSSRQWVCLTTDCYQLHITAVDVEISWSLADSQQITASGYAPAQDKFCTNNSAFANVPSPMPTYSLLPTSAPTPLPSSYPTFGPTHIPTPNPTHSPTYPPTSFPTPLPTSAPTEMCIDGEYISRGRCLPCEAGRFATVSMADDGMIFPSSCTWCPIGHYSRTGASTCLECTTGKYSSLDRSDCVQCHAGQYANTTYQGCFNCTAGRYAPSPLNDQCLECGPGYSTGVEISATSCSKCSPGTYSIGDGVVNTCSDCLEGTYSDTAASECTACEVGTFAASPQSSSCEDCARGKSTLDQTNATECTKCEAGYYSPTRAAHCLECAVGKYAKKAGTADCLACNSGRYADTTASVSCAKCNNGTFQESSGQSYCNKCEIGKYAPYASSKYCFACDNGHTSTEGSAYCNRCDPGYFWAYSKKLKTWGCDSCPVGATCSGGLDQPVAEEGYWIDRKAAATDPSLVRYVYPCVRETCSKLSSSTRRLSANCLLLSNFTSPECSQDALVCATGSTGPLCGSCEDGWNYNSQELRCRPCGESATWTQAFLSLVIVIAAFSFVYSLRSGKVYVPEPMRFLSGGRAHIKIPGMGVVLHINRAALKLMVSTYQIVMSVGNTLEIVFPEPYVSFSKGMAFVQLDFISLDCMKGSYYLSVYTTSAFPIALVAICWLVYFIRKAVFNYRNPDVEDEAFFVKLKNEHINFTLMLIFIVLPPVAKKQFRALDCMELEDGSQYLRDDSGIDCQSDGYTQFAFINALLITLYQSIPLIYIILLCRVRDKLVPLAGENTTYAEALDRRDRDKSLDSLRFLFNDTKVDRWYFEVMEFYRRMLFTGVLPLMSKDTAMIAYIGSVMGLLSVIYFRELLPFRTPWTNVIAVVCQYVILIVFLAALTIETNTRPLLKFNDLTFGIFLVAVNVFIMLLVLFGGYMRYTAALAEKHDILNGNLDVKIVWAAQLTSEELQSTVDAASAKLPPSHILVYYYTSLPEAKAIVTAKGLPALKLNPLLTTKTKGRPNLLEDKEVDMNLIGERGGVVVTLKGPHVIRDSDDKALALMSPFATSKEVVFCLMLPRALLWKLDLVPDKADETSQGKRTASVERPSYASSTGVPLGTSLDDVSVSNSLTPTEKNPLAPKELMQRMKKRDIDVMHLRLLPVEILEAMGAKHQAPATPSATRSLIHRHVEEDREIARKDMDMEVLSTRSVLSAYQLKDTIETDDRKSLQVYELMSKACNKPEMIINYVVDQSKPVHVHSPGDFNHYLTYMKAARDACRSLNLLPVYCYTSSVTAHELLNSGIKLSPVYQFDMGIFFTTKSPCSLGFGSAHYEANVIEHLFGSGQSQMYAGKGLLDAVLVYGAEPYCIEKAGSSNRVMFGQNDFLGFVKIKHVKSFHLRNDRILLALNLSRSRKHRKIESIGMENDRFREEVEADEEATLVLSQVEKEAEHNALYAGSLEAEGDEWLFMKTQEALKSSHKAKTSSFSNLLTNKKSAKTKKDHSLLAVELV